MSVRYSAADHERERERFDRPARPTAVGARSTLINEPTRSRYSGPPRQVHTMFLPSIALARLASSFGRSSLEHIRACGITIVAADERSRDCERFALALI
jgi:hypothetical protein